MVPAKRPRVFVIRSDQTPGAINTLLGAVIAFVAIPKWGWIFGGAIIGLGVFQIILAESRARREDMEKATMAAQLAVLNKMDSDRNIAFFDRARELQQNLFLLLANESIKTRNGEHDAAYAAGLEYLAKYQIEVGRVATGFEERGKVLKISSKAYGSCEMKDISEIMMAIHDACNELNG